LHLGIFFVKVLCFCSKLLNLCSYLFKRFLKIIFNLSSLFGLFFDTLLDCLLNIFNSLFYLFNATFIASIFLYKIQTILAQFFFIIFHQILGISEC